MRGDLLAVAQAIRLARRTMRVNPAKPVLGVRVQRDRPPDRGGGRFPLRILLTPALGRGSDGGETVTGLVHPDAFAHLVEAHVDAAQRRPTPMRRAGTTRPRRPPSDGATPGWRAARRRRSVLVDAVRDAGQFEQWL